MKIKKMISLLLAVVMVFSASTLNAGAVGTFEEWVGNWEYIDNGTGYITLTPGEDETKMNFSWQSSFKSYDETIFFGKEENLSDATELKVKTELNIIGFEWTHNATTENLENNTTYYYQYTVNKEKSEIYSFRTGDADVTTVLFVSDSQIGRSSGTQEEIYQNDTYGWTKTLDSAVSFNDDIDFILSSGDQVEDSFSEEQYTYFESPEVLRSLPVAAAIGNHDFYTPNYRNHFNNPNSDTVSLFNWPAGKGYYFEYNNVLFIVVDSNNFVPSANRRLIKNACEEYPDAKWRVLMMHHSPFDASGADDIGNKFARGTVVPYIDEFGIDICLSGHDHYYSRSHMIRNKEITDDVCENGVYKNPKGTLYMTQNSSSGSNYSGTGDVISEYCAFALQERRTTYSLIEITSDSLTLKSYHADTNEEFDSITIEK
ncbi:MAG: FN3 domain-containing metallophosphoesterase family protein [Acutalibacteraceae bacterium]|nr:FN3 domain-containing metallophosphoesterase family protein [Acutalibacteraceae bacterium]